MKFWDNFKEAVDKGMDASKDVFTKSVEISKDAIDKTSGTIKQRTLMFEFGHLAQKLGTLVFEKLEEGKIIEDDLEVQALLKKMTDIKEEASKCEEEK